MGDKSNFGATEQSGTIWSSCSSENTSFIFKLFAPLAVLIIMLAPTPLGLLMLLLLCWLLNLLLDAKKSDVGRWNTLSYVDIFFFPAKKNRMFKDKKTLVHQVLTFFFPTRSCLFFYQHCFSHWSFAIKFRYHSAPGFKRALRNWAVSRGVSWRAADFKLSATCMPRPPFTASKLPLSLSLSFISHLSSHRLPAALVCVYLPCPWLLRLNAEAPKDGPSPIHMYFIYIFICVCVYIYKTRTHSRERERERDFLLIDYSRDKRRELPTHLTSNNPFGLSAFSLFYFSLSVLLSLVATDR